MVSVVLLQTVSFAELQKEIRLLYQKELAVYFLTSKVAVCFLLTFRKSGSCCSLRRISPPRFNVRVHLGLLVLRYPRGSRAQGIALLLSSPYRPRAVCSSLPALFRSNQPSFLIDRLCASTMAAAVRIRPRRDISRAPCRASRRASHCRGQPRPVWRVELRSHS